MNVITLLIVLLLAGLKTREVSGRRHHAAMMATMSEVGPVGLEQFDAGNQQIQDILQLQLQLQADLEAHYNEANADLVSHLTEQMGNRIEDMKDERDDTGYAPGIATRWLRHRGDNLHQLEAGQEFVARHSPKFTEMQEAARGVDGCKPVAPEPVIRTPKPSVCRKQDMVPGAKSRSYIDHPSTAAILLLEQLDTNEANGKFIQQCVARVAGLSKARVVDEVVVLLMGPPDAPLHRKLLDHHLTGENDFLLFTPEQLTPLQALHRAVSTTHAPRVVVFDQHSLGNMAAGAVKNGWTYVRCVGALLHVLASNHKLGLVASSPHGPPADPKPASVFSWLTGASGAKEKTGADDPGYTVSVNGLSIDVREVEAAAPGSPFAVDRAAVLEMVLHRSEANCGAGGAHTQLGDFVVSSRAVLAEVSARMWLASRAVAAARTEACPAPRDLHVHSGGAARTAQTAQLMFGAQAAPAGLAERMRRLTEDPELPPVRPINACGQGLRPMCSAGKEGGMPTLAYAVHYFEKTEMISKLRNFLNPHQGMAEALVLDDSRTELEAWANETAELRRKGLPVFLLYAHDLEQARGMNRLVSMADTDVVVLTQGVVGREHDLPGYFRAGGYAWENRTRSLFGAQPQLGLLGGFQGFEAAVDPDHFVARPARGWGTLWERSAKKGKWIGPIGHYDPRVRQHIMCVEVAALPGPLVVRQSAFLHAGMFNLNLSCAGEPAPHMSEELSLRMWTMGWKVGVYESAFEHDFNQLYDKHNFNMDKHQFNTRVVDKRKDERGWLRQQFIENATKFNEVYNNQMLYDMYHPLMHDIAHAANDCNSELQVKISHNKW